MNSNSVTEEERGTLYRHEASDHLIPIPNVFEENTATTSMYGLLDLSVRQPGQDDHSYFFTECPVPDFVMEEANPNLDCVDTECPVPDFVVEETCPNLDCVDTECQVPEFVVEETYPTLDSVDESRNFTEERHPLCTFTFGADDDEDETLREIVVCPSANDLMLKAECKIPCPYHGCNKIIVRHSLIPRHLQNHYGSWDASQAQLGYLRPIRRNILVMKYYCPVRRCIYSQSVDLRHFLSLKYLKQHFSKVHAPKVYICTKCSTEKFATKAYLDAHERICGIKFTCCVCPSKVYRSLEALQTHSRRHHSSHPLDLEKYQTIINASKPIRPSRPSSSTSTSTVASVPPNQKKLAPLVPKVGSEPTSIARVLLSLPNLSPRVLIDCGSQTGPPVKRGVKRKPSASQQCQTQSMETRTTGTETQLPVLTRTLERKKSAETQTKKLRISTQTQTPVVTKRKRSTRNMESSSMETQTSFKALNSVDHRQLSVTLSPLPPSQTDVAIPSVSVDEVPSAKRTQTDPNPFFGLNRDSDSIMNEFEVFFTDSEVRDMMSQTSTETQTVIGASTNIYMESALGSVVDPTEALISGEELYFQSSAAVQQDFGGSENDMDHYETYLETMDNETQTFETATAFDQLFFP